MTLGKKCEKQNVPFKYYLRNTNIYTGNSSLSTHEVKEVCIGLGVKHEVRRY